MPTREPTTTPSITPTPEATPGLETTPTVSPSPTASASATPTLPANTYAEQVVAILNQVRTDRGLSPLRIHPNLMLAAQGYAQHMADNNYFGHTGLDGSTPNSRMLAAGYTAGCKGEAISAGQVSPSAAVDAWLGSGSHASILLGPDTIEIGVGYAFRPGTTYSHYWVLGTGPAAFPCP